MALVNMARTPEEVKQEVKEMKDGTDMPLYPWGLSLRLDDESLKKLGMALPAGGATMKIEALATVTSVGSRQEVDGETCSHCELQITALDVTPAAAATDGRAERMYPAKDAD